MNEMPLPGNNACEQILGWQIGAGLGDQPAILAGTRTLTYAQLCGLVNRIGNALRGAGVGRSDRVTLLTKDSPEMVATYLAVLKIGAVAVAVNTRASGEDLAHFLTDTACKAFVFDPEFSPIYSAAAGLTTHRPALLIDDVAGFAAGHDDSLETAPVLATDQAFWIYTSGTTGKSKAAIHCHRMVSIAHLHLRENLGVKPGDKLFSSSKLFFAFALGHCLIGGLKCGATIILHDEWPDGPSIAAVVERHRPDLMFCVPTLYRNLLRDGYAATPPFTAIRRYVSAGEKLPEGLSRQWEAASGSPILEGIGTSETVFLMLVNTPTAHRAGSAGRPVPWAEVQLRDQDGGVVTTPDEPGVLWVRAASVAAGYWNQPEKTAAAFVDGWYCTGDLFSFDAEGWWYHQGRADDMLKISGQWVNPTEIEERAIEVPGVAEAAVVGVANEDGLVRLGLVLVAQGGANEKLLAPAVQEHLTKHLSIYKCPRRIAFVDEMPRTATGKLQRFRLRQLLMEEQA